MIMRCQTTSLTTSPFANARVPFAGERSKGSGACQNKGKNSTRGILLHTCKNKWKNKVCIEKMANDTINQL